MYYVVGSIRPGEHHKVHLVQFDASNKPTGKVVQEDTVQLDGHLAVRRDGALLLLKEPTDHPDLKPKKPSTTKPKE